MTNLPDQLASWLVIAGALFSLYWTGTHNHDKYAYRAASVPTLILVAAAILILIRVFYFGEHA